MKKYLFYISMTLILLASCERNQVIPIEEQLILQKKSITVPTEGGTFSVDYKAISVVSYTIPEGSGWIIPDSDATKNTSPYSSGSLSFGVYSSDTLSPRTGYIYLHCQEDTDTVTVSQNMKEFLSLPQKEITIDPEGGIFSVEVLTNTTTISFSCPDEWISLLIESGVENPELIEQNKYLVKFEAEAGSVDSERSSEIYFIYGKGRDTLVVNQPIKEQLVLNPDNIEADASGGTFSIELGHNVDYTVSVPEGADWVSIPATQNSSYVREKISIVLERNNDTQTRECTISFRSEDEDLSADLQISQKGISVNYLNFMGMENPGWYSFTPGAEFTIEYEKFVSQYAVTNRNGIGGFRIVSGENYFVMEGIDKDLVVGNTFTIQTLQNFLSNFNRNETGTYVLEKVSEEDGTMWLFDHQKDQGMIVKNK